MRKCQIFVGSSHPELGQLICEKLGLAPAPCRVSKFSNGETACDIGVSVRDTHAIIIIGSADLINDRIMELLVLVSGCRGGSASKITCVIPMFPYSKQSKMKKHRGSITARMLANLVTKAGADHVITMDLHASQMQGFFKKPVDNLSAGPTLARWIRDNVPDYRSSVIVSKNPGGTKRVTALADALKVNFAMIHTDRRRQKGGLRKNFPTEPSPRDDQSREDQFSATSSVSSFGDANAGYGDERTKVHIARVLKGHVVHQEEQDSSQIVPEELEETGVEESVSTEPATDNAQRILLGGTQEADGSDDEEIDYSKEQVIALAGDVYGRPAIILDDMIDRPDSYIAAAEHCVLNCGAKTVYVIATHGVFGADSLDILEASPFIHRIVVTNTYPIYKNVPKLRVIDISAILAECIRRNHNGESISNLFEQLAII